MNGMTQSAGFIDNNMPSLTKPEGFDEDKEMMMNACCLMIWKYLSNLVIPPK